MTHFELLPSPLELQHELPLNAHQLEFIKHSRHTVKRILDGTDSRKLLIVGPCSIHDITAALDYATKLKQLAQEVVKSFFIVMRAHFEKPRTSTGWKGMMYDPMLDGSHDLSHGLRSSRQLLQKLADLEMPSATEFLDPMASYYLGDLISWGSIGARTTASQIHRQFSSGLPMPIGFKNGTDGDIHTAVNAVLSAAIPHAYIGMGENGRTGIIRTHGNKDAHIVLRGGEKQPNYDPASINHALDLLKKAQLPSRLIIDCSHDNSSKKPENQPLVFKSVIKQVLEGNQDIRGVIIESHLNGGNQSPDKPTKLKYAISLTDACLDWNTTNELILWGADQLQQTSEPQFIYQ